MVRTEGTVAGAAKTLGIHEIRLSNYFLEHSEMEYDEFDVIKGRLAIEIEQEAQELLTKIHARIDVFKSIYDRHINYIFLGHYLTSKGISAKKLGNGMYEIL